MRLARSITVQNLAMRAASFLRKATRAGRPITPAAGQFAEVVCSELSLAERFQRMYELNLWGEHGSRSGLGSSRRSTARVRAQLPGLLRSLGVRRLLDVPCGDFHWMRRVDLDGIDYTGADIVSSLVAELRVRYERPGRRFIHVDLTIGPLPPADAVLCRDCLVHLSYANIARCFDAIQASGARYLLTTTFPAHDDNTDVRDGEWRPLNLARPPFCLSAPVASIVEGCTEDGSAYVDKSLTVWRVEELPSALSSAERR
jgi:hypothetical protein